MLEKMEHRLHQVLGQLLAGFGLRLGLQQPEDDEGEREVENSQAETPKEIQEETQEEIEDETEEETGKGKMKILRKGPAMRVIFFYPGEEGTYVDHAEVTLYENGIVHICSNQEESTTHLQNCEILWRFETDAEERVNKVRLLKPKSDSKAESPHNKPEKFGTEKFGTEKSDPIDSSSNPLGNSFGNSSEDSSPSVGSVDGKKEISPLE